jgi:hypothetical protein
MLQVFVIEYTRPENKRFIFYKPKGKKETGPLNFFFLMPKAGHTREHGSIITIRRS